MKGFIEYCMPLFAAMGIIHISCGTGASGFAAALFYLFAILFALVGFFVLLDSHKEADKLEEEVRELEKYRKQYEEADKNLGIAVSLLDEHQKYKYYDLTER